MARYGGDYDDREYGDRGVPLHGNEEWGRGYGPDRGLGFGQAFARPRGLAVGVGEAEAGLV